MSLAASLAASQSDIDDGSESDFVYHNPPTVTESQSIFFQVREASSNVKDQSVDEETLDIFSEINSNNLVSTNTGPAIWLRCQNVLVGRVSEIPCGK